MERSVVRIVPEVLGAMFGFARVEHVSVRTGLGGTQMIHLQISDPRLPKGVDEVEVLIHKNPNGSLSFGWRPKGMDTVISGQSALAMLGPQSGPLQ